MLRKWEVDKSLMVAASCISIQRSTDCWELPIIFQPNVDRIDVSGISKSTEFDIRGEQIDIEIPWNEKFRNEFASGERMIAYALLAIPIGVTGEQFDTLRQAEALGARILEERGGPP
jgi:hypothetical protein